MEWNEIKWHGLGKYEASKNRIEDVFELERAVHETLCFINQTWIAKRARTNHFAMHTLTWSSTWTVLHKHHANLWNAIWKIKHTPGSVLHQHPYEFIMFIPGQEQKFTETQNKHIIVFISHHTSQIQAWFNMNQHISSKSIKWSFTCQTLNHYIYFNSAWKSVI